MSLDGLSTPLLDDLRLLNGRLTRQRLGGAALPANADQLMLLLGDAWLMGRALETNRAVGRRTCRICGCWQYAACRPACAWVAEDLCSACEAVGSA